MANTYPKTPDNRYPYTKYQAGRAPVVVSSEAEELALGPSWQSTPINAEYPRFMYHVTREARIVQNEREKEALGAGWETKPIDKTDHKDITKVDTFTLRYLKNIGQTKVNSVEEAQIFADNLSPAEKTKFFDAVEKWKDEERATDEKLQAANLPEQPRASKAKSAS